MRRSRTLPAVALICLAGLTACNDGTTATGPPATPTGTAAPATGSTSPGAGDGSASTRPSGSPSASPTDTGPLPTNRIEAASLHKAVLGRNAAETAEERAVVDAWMAFWQGAADTYYYYKPVPGFDEVARGDARRQILESLAKTQREKRRVVGWARDNITSVTVDGDRATVRDCTENYTFSVDEEGEPKTRPTPWYDITGTLERTHGRWTVVDQSSRDLDSSCL